MDLTPDGPFGELDQDKNTLPTETVDALHHGSIGSDQAGNPAEGLNLKNTVGQAQARRHSVLSLHVSRPASSDKSYRLVGSHRAAPPMGSCATDNSVAVRTYSKPVTPSKNPGVSPPRTPTRNSQDGLTGLVEKRAGWWEENCCTERGATRLNLEGQTATMTGSVRQDDLMKVSTWHWFAKDSAGLDKIDMQRPCNPHHFSSRSLSSASHV
jgi:hypothetical protein